MKLKDPPVAGGAPHPAPPPRVLRLGSRTIPVVGPSWRDPRLHLAAVIVSLQVLGQVALRFPLSIAQILVSILTCAALEVAITLRQRKMLVWPGSALVTGNGVALLLRVVGTAHGAWWSLQGAGYFALAAALSLVSKHVIRRHGRHLFNPSNFGLVVVFLAFGSRVVNPQDLWWGPMSTGLVLAMAVIVVGGITLVTRLKLLGVVAGFWLTFAAGAGVVAARGHCITARWSLNPVCGHSFWWILALSPEILVFAFFMVTDPRTIPEGRVARVVFGATVGLLAALAVAPATTEFWTKVGVLAALLVACAARPLLERTLPAAGSAADRLGPWLAGEHSYRGVVVGAAVPVLVAVLAVAGQPAQPAIAARTAPLPRPSVAISPPAVPPVSIDQSIRNFDAAITTAQAQQMAGDLATDLAIEAEALQARTAALAASADSGRWLTTITQKIAAAGPSGALSVATYTFSALTVELVTNPARPQDPPTIGVWAVGTIATAVEGGSSPHPAGRPAPFTGSFGLALAGGHYLIIGEFPGSQDS